MLNLCPSCGEAREGTLCQNCGDIPGPRHFRMMVDLGEVMRAQAPTAEQRLRYIEEHATRLGYTEASKFTPEGYLVDLASKYADLAD
jgi:hypothetical protein